MDVNGTHFQLLLGYDDWARCSDHTDNEQGPGKPLGPIPKPAHDASEEAWVLRGYGDLTTCPEGQTRLRQLWEKEPVNANIQQVHLEWDDVHQEIALTSKLFLLTNPSAPSTLLTFDRRRGASSDRYGNWYWIDDTQSEIRVNSAGTGTTAHFWSADDLVEITAPAAKGTLMFLLRQER